MTALVWIQREFRVDYLPALQAALAENEKVIVAYFHDSTAAVGGATKVWLSHALKTLKADYQARGGQLWVVNEAIDSALERFVKEYEVSSVYYSFQVGQVFKQTQQVILEKAKALNLFLKPFDSEDFFDATEVVNLKGSPYLVFTPYYKNALKIIDRVQPLLVTQKDLSQTAKVACPEDFTKLPTDLEAIQNKAWANKMMAYWQVGEQAAWQRFQNFITEKAYDYDVDRDFPELDATSCLSPYLHFGHINPVAMYFTLQSMAESQKIKIEQVQPWIRQLFWRSFARYLMVWFADKEKRSFNDKYANLEWQDDPEKLKAWQLGQTGIPIVDAGMRELWETGTMHNRVRMLVASLLTKNMNVNWLHGLNWFEETLFDADPANNSMGWQWVAGCGVDAAPYYRLFNPVVQSQKFDAQGAYIRRWVPELKALSAKAIHEPWNHAMECQMKQVELGKTYPEPIVDLKRTRDEHLARVESLKTMSK
jgi:deoxyribodipyrimidine photo-lyase